MDTGAALALGSHVCLIGFLVFFVLSLRLWEWEDTLGTIGALFFQAWLGLGIASLVLIDFSWDQGSIFERIVLVEFWTVVIGGAAALMLLFTLAPLYYGYSIVRRWHRIISQVGHDFDDDGIRIHRDETLERYYAVDGQRLYPAGYKKVCWWEDEEGGLHLSNRDGSLLRKMPRALKHSDDFANADITQTPYGYGRRKRIRQEQAA